jgi:hypothetical protein
VSVPPWLSALLACWPCEHSHSVRVCPTHMRVCTADEQPALLPAFLVPNSLLGGASDLGARNWDSLSAARAAVQPSRRSIDMGGLAQQMAALDMSNNAARASLVESCGMRPSASFTASFNASLNNRLSVDCSGPGYVFAPCLLVVDLTVLMKLHKQLPAVIACTVVCVHGQHAVDLQHAAHASCVDSCRLMPAGKAACPTLVFTSKDLCLLLYGCSSQKLHQPSGLVTIK